MNVTQSWQQFVLNRETRVNVRKEILDSWQRCRQLGISHELDQVASHISSDEFIKRREKNEVLLAAAVPVMEELYNHLKGGGYLLLLADADGYLIEMMADAKAQQICDRGGISPGARWMEDNVGSTGLSIALRTRTAMATSATEHFCTAFRIWDCSACPIYVDGEFMGVFDVCRVGPGNDIRELFTLAVSGARAVAERLRYERNRIREEILSEILLHSWDINLQSTGILSFDKWGKIIHKNKLASEFIHLLQQENQRLNPSSQTKEHHVIYQMKSHSEETAEIFLQGQRYLLESKQLTKQDQNLATVVLVTPETQKKITYPVAKPSQEEQSEVHAAFKTKNPLFKKTLHVAAKAARSQACILIQGESGTGKDFMARAIHRESSRRSKPFIALNCASLPKELIASELFGYAPGAFTGAKQQGNPGKIEAANGGTLFLDEIADMPLELQAVFLRALEEKQITRVGSTTPIPVDVRFVAASHKDLWLLVEKGEFRQDLFYRLNVFTVHIPPLRERPEDLELLINQMLSASCEQAWRNIITFTPEAMELFLHYAWPGNLRELRNVIERITYLHEQDQFDARHVQEFLDFGETAKIKMSERERIELALKIANGNRVQAARQLNISRSALYRKLEKYSM
ncbi:sigma-54-dependent Fis family transcriptional regulator [Effusibacillus dendaii]|uniref:Signal-transduction and transcriptional-control protein n=1 Tax=Effusibacillus dendaii TaxID=2743772 RepID=A0A7I8DDI5_9BACL|nr:sigma-54-dependent Fis family transcriptional regulator [Effusibacillus dendaii]BCJ88155.1 signal-transduction and transcriptional-control protein [Effusibacillus dendaii]